MSCVAARDYTATVTFLLCPSFCLRRVASTARHERNNWQTEKRIVMREGALEYFTSQAKLDLGPWAAFFPSFFFLLLFLVPPPLTLPFIFPFFILCGLAFLY